MSELQVFLEEVLATPLASFIFSIIGTLIVILTCLSKIKSAIFSLRMNKEDYEQSNIKLLHKIEELELVRKELQATKQENLELKNDVKSFKTALRLMAENNAIGVSSGASQQIVNILKEDGAENVEK